MKQIIKNMFTAALAIIGLIGGLVWAINTKWDYEPIILIFLSATELLACIILRNISEKPESIPVIKFQEIPSINKNKNEQNVNVNVSFPIPAETAPVIAGKIEETTTAMPRNEIIEIMKGRVQILFIDDDKKFKIVQNLKDGGWKLTKTVEDIKNVDVPIVNRSQILFVDINGVGKILNLEYEGLDLALMLKQKYPDKKVIIYSANKNSYSFHEAWSVCDYRLEKNALPYHFQSLVESYSLDLYRKTL